MKRKIKATSESLPFQIDDFGDVLYWFGEHKSFYLFLEFIDKHIPDSFDYIYEPFYEYIQDHMSELEKDIVQ